MNFNDIRTMAKAMGINTNKMKKTEIIRSMQRAEINFDCYGTERVQNCHEDACLWRQECVLFR